jgi:hypothetical protein
VFGCDFVVGTVALPSGVTMRLRPLRRWGCMGVRMASVLPSTSTSALGSSQIS